MYGPISAHLVSELVIVAVVLLFTVGPKVGRSVRNSCLRPHTSAVKRTERRAVGQATSTRVLDLARGSGMDLPPRRHETRRLDSRTTR